MLFKTMKDGTIAYGPNEILDLFNKTIEAQMDLDAKAKFKPNEKVKIIASKEKLIKYIESTGETYPNAKKEAILLLANDYGVVIGKTNCDEGPFYTVEFDMVPMSFLPESFLARY